MDGPRHIMILILWRWISKLDFGHREKPKVIAPLHSASSLEEVDGAAAF
jgi:hypothetical protein